MGHDFYAASDAARAVLDEAESVLGAGFLKTIFEGTPEAVTDTRIAQTGLLAVGVAITRHLATMGIEPAGCAGHSLGEYPALVAAGALPFSDALRLVQERARLMAEEAPPGAMAAVMGLGVEAIKGALPEGADLANLNGPNQTIISGPVAAIEAAEGALKDAGAKRVIKLNVSGAFHSRLMEPAAEAFRGALADVKFNAPTVRFVSSVSGQDERDPERIRALLGQQIAAPVRWTDVMGCIGAAEALEVGPGRVLLGLAKRTPDAPSITPAGTLDGAKALGDDS
jgi:[acyl-carrier-protein] S-malonyltransferase